MREVHADYCFFVTKLVLQEIVCAVALHEIVGGGDKSQEAEQSQCNKGKGQVGLRAYPFLLLWRVVFAVVTAAEIRERDFAAKAQD